MISKSSARLILISTAIFSLAACSGADNSQTKEAVVANDVEPITAHPKLKDTSSVSPGTHRSPIKFRYEIQGTPIVGQPVSINLFVSSAEKGAPINLYFRVNDASSMLFPESQAKQMTFSAEALNAASTDASAAQQVTVIPQREGRLYLVVSAEVESARGTMLSTTSIPIQVGSAPPELESAGELVETEDGETVVSMPATESN